MEGVLMMCGTIIFLGVFFIIFYHTKAGKKFFDE